MKVLITGATGFLGSQLVHALMTKGHHVVILKRSSSETRRIADMLHLVSSYDLDRDGLEAPFKENGKIDAVIHTATCYGRKGERASDLVEANLAFPVRLLEVSAAYGVDAFLNTDTSLPRFLNPYALSKSHFAEWGKFFAGSGRVRFVNIKLEQFYGPGDDDTKFTAHVMRSCSRNVPELKLTSGVQKRDFIFIDDVVQAYRLLLERAVGKSLSFGEYGLGSGEAVTIREFVETVHRLTNSSTTLRFGAVPFRPNEVMEARADIGPLLALGWSPKVSLIDGIKRSIEAESVNYERRTEKSDRSMS